MSSFYICASASVRQQNEAHQSCCEQETHIYDHLCLHSFGNHSDNGCKVCMHFSYLKQGGFEERKEMARVTRRRKMSAIIDSITENAGIEMSRGITPDR